jgi:hypothetical protein
MNTMMTQAIGGLLLHIKNSIKLAECSFLSTPKPLMQPPLLLLLEVLAPVQDCHTTLQTVLWESQKALLHVHYLTVIHGKALLSCHCPWKHQSWVIFKE